jgi:hypothetical protein
LTQLPSNTAVASTILDLPEVLPRRSSSLLPRPQLVLQPISNQNHHRRISTRPEEATEDRKPHAVHADGVFTTDHIQSTLQQTFGITTFRENQLAIIQATLAQEDIFVIMRTGGGKSLLYQLPVVLERAQHKVTLVISPLLSLMQGTCSKSLYWIFTKSNSKPMLLLDQHSWIGRFSYLFVHRLCDGPYF